MRWKKKGTNEDKEVEEVDDLIKEIVEEEECDVAIEDGEYEEG